MASEVARKAARKAGRRDKAQTPMADVKRRILHRTRRDAFHALGVTWTYPFPREETLWD
jgi:hypothetical protein